MKFEKQINTLSELSWKFKGEIDRMKVLVKDENISSTYRKYLETEIKKFKSDMQTNVEAIDKLIKEDV